jgi:L-amino acid N-acyltransferase YncA
MTYLIRPSTAADCSAITTIYGHAVIHGTASWELEAPDLADMLKRREAITATGYPYLVAERTGDILGYAYASAYRPRPAYRSTVEDSVYISPSAQRQGVGTALLSALITECTARGYRQMIGIVGDGHVGAAGSLKLHEALGFELLGIARNVGYKHGRWLDQLILQKSLGESDQTPPSFS